MVYERSREAAMRAKRAIGDESAQEILDFIRDNPDCTVKDMCRALFRSDTAVIWHLKGRLKDSVHRYRGEGNYYSYSVKENS